MAKSKGRGKRTSATNSNSSSSSNISINQDLIEVIVEEVSFRCPKRGLVKQKVKVKKFKPIVVETVTVMNASDTISEIESIDDGLDIYPSEDKENLS